MTCEYTPLLDRLVNKHLYLSVIWYAPTFHQQLLYALTFHQQQISTNYELADFTQPVKSVY